MGVASTNTNASRKRHTVRRASDVLQLGDVAANVRERLTTAVQERPIAVIAGAMALGFVAGAALTRRDGSLLLTAARVALGWAAANMDS